MMKNPLKSVFFITLSWVWETKSRFLGNSLFKRFSQTFKTFAYKNLMFF